MLFIEANILTLLLAPVLAFVLVALVFMLCEASVQMPQVELIQPTDVGKNGHIKQ